MYLPIVNLLSADENALETTACHESLRAVFCGSEAALVPVVENGQFKGVVFRCDVEKYPFACAAQLLSKETIYLSPENSLGEALEVFEWSGQGEIPVVWAGGEVAGVMRLAEIEGAFAGVKLSQDKSAITQILPTPFQEKEATRKPASRRPCPKRFRRE